MLHALGNTERVINDTPCCDICYAIPKALDFEAIASTVQASKRTRRTAVRIVDENLARKLKENLIVERQAYMDDHPSFKILGPSFVCADCAIDAICDLFHQLMTLTT